MNEKTSPTSNQFAKKTIYMDRNTHDMLLEIAAMNNRSFNKQVLHILKEAIRNRDTWRK